jgi:TonB family protein
VPELAKSSKPVLKEAEAPKPSERLMALNSLMSKTMSGGVEKLLNEKSVIDTAKAQPMGKVSLEARAQALSNYDVALNSGNAVTIVQGLGGSNDREVGAGISGGNFVGYGKGEKPQLASIGKSNITLDAGMASVEQGLTKEEVGAVIERHKSEIRYCYEAAMLREPRVEGRISLAFTIDKAGRVVKAGVANSSVNDPRLAQCLLARLPNWKFPNPKGGVSVDVSYPFVFKTLGGA